MKISVIGGAGVRTVNFINGLMDRKDAICVTEVALYDIDQPKLKIIEALSQQAVKRRNGSIAVHAEQDIAALLRGADAVVTTLRVGGDHSRTVDEQIAFSHGLIGQETTGAGGFFMAARTLWALVGYLEKVQLYAPTAAVFNFTNPSGLLTQALHTMGFTNVIGICDAPSSVKTRMAEALNVTEAQLDVRFAGLNHLSFIHSVRVDGTETLGALLADQSFLKRVNEFSVFDPECFRLSECLPNEYLYYYYHRERALANMHAAAMTRGRMIETINREMFDELKGMDIASDPEKALQTFLFYLWKRELSYMSSETGRSAALPERGKLEIPSGMGYAGVMLDCLQALSSDTPAQVVLNVKNNGTLPFLSDDDVAELSCRVSKDGIVPLPAAPLNAHCRTLIRTVKDYEHLASEALLECSRQKAIAALTLHPLVMSYSLAKQLVSECIDAYPNDVRLS